MSEYGLSYTLPLIHCWVLLLHCSGSVTYSTQGAPRRCGQVRRGRGEVPAHVRKTVEGGLGMEWCGIKGVRAEKKHVANKLLSLSSSAKMSFSPPVCSRSSQYLWTFYVLTKFAVCFLVHSGAWRRWAANDRKTWSGVSVTRILQLWQKAHNRTVSRGRLRSWWRADKNMHWQFHWHAWQDHRQPDASTLAQGNTLSHESQEMVQFE